MKWDFLSERAGSLHREVSRMPGNPRWWTMGSNISIRTEVENSRLNQLQCSCDPHFLPQERSAYTRSAVWDVRTTSFVCSLCCRLMLLCLNSSILPWQHHSRDILYSHWVSALPLAPPCPWWRYPSLNCNLFVVHLSLLFVINHAFYPEQ